LQVQYQAYSPLHGGGTFSVFKDPTVAKIAAAHSVSPAQVALRWVTQQGVVAVTSDSDPAYATQDLSIFGFTLTGGEISPGRQSHSDRTLYISLVFLYTKYTGWRQNDFNVYA
jgi:diketogulonate reductase-like aldo/keto reductase